MKISVTFRNGEGENWQKVYAEERIQKLKKYLDMPAETHIILSTEKFRNFAEINLSANGWNVNAKEEAKDMHLAVDGCIDKIEKQLKKQKEKNREHKPKSIRHSGSKVVEGDEEESTSSVNILNPSFAVPFTTFTVAVVPLNSPLLVFTVGPNDGGGTRVRLLLPVVAISQGVSRL